MWAVRFEGVTKQYRRGESPHRSIRADLANTARWIRRREAVPDSSWFDALSQVDLEIEEGTSSAIVGRNGAGKSTALRLISRITYPTEGTVRVRGRVGALIEIGAGVHPDLSGRENIWLYGSFLGFTRAEIRQRFDSIVEFAELEHVIDTQVKFYSTGMSLRLGFAIASHLEPAIFIVDESLAVGDGSFQAKCIQRMNQLGQDGTTVVFVSHELAAVEALCDQAIWLDQGKVMDQGPIADILRSYHRSLDEGLMFEAPAKSSDVVRCVKATTQNAMTEPTGTFKVGDPMTIHFVFEAKTSLANPRVNLRITDGQWDDLIECVSPVDAVGGTGTRWGARCKIESLPLNPRVYQVWCSVTDTATSRRVMEWNEVGAFRVEAGDDWAIGDKLTSVAGPPVAVNDKWTIES